jgi:hypothetical protein
LRLVFLLLLAGGVFEKEDDTNGVELLKRFGVQRDQLFELDILCAEGFNEVCEHALDI